MNQFIIYCEFIGIFHKCLDVSITATNPVKNNIQTWNPFICIKYYYLQLCQALFSCKLEFQIVTYFTCKQIFKHLLSTQSRNYSNQRRKSPFNIYTYHYIANHRFNRRLSRSRLASFSHIEVSISQPKYNSSAEKWRKCSRHLRPRLSQRTLRGVAPTKYNPRARSESKQSLHNPVWEKRKTRDRSMAAENRKCDLINWFGCPSGNHPLAMTVGKSAELLVFFKILTASIVTLYVHVCTSRSSTQT